MNKPFRVKSLQTFEQEFQLTEADRSAAGVDIFTVTVSKEENFIGGNKSDCRIFAVRTADMMQLNRNIFQTDVDAGVKGDIC